MFERFNVEREIEKTLQPQRSGCPAAVISFSTAPKRCTQSTSTRAAASVWQADVEESLVRINLEAAEEIARQLRLRNIGGLIICDFIDMRLRKIKRRVLEHLKECMKEDSAKCTILGMSEFGLVEMTRQRNRESLAQTLFTNCPYCSGSGLVKTHESISIEIERALKKAIGYQQQFGLKLVVHPELDQYLRMGDKAHLKKIAEEQNAHLDISSDDTFHLNEFRFYSTTNLKPLDV